MVWFGLLCNNNNNSRQHSAALSDGLVWTSVFSKSMLQPDRWFGLDSCVTATATAGSSHVRWFGLDSCVMYSVQQQHGSSHDRCIGLDSCVMYSVQQQHGSSHDRRFGLDSCVLYSNSMAAAMTDGLVWIPCCLSVLGIDWARLSLSVCYRWNWRE